MVGSGVRKNYRVVLLTGKNLLDFAFESLKKICECNDIKVVAIFINDEQKQKEAFLLRSLKVVRKRKLLTLVLGYHFLKARLGLRGGGFSINCPRIPAANLGNFCSADLHRIRDLYSQNTVSQLKSYQPDLCFHYGYGLIKEPILSLPKGGVIGYHHGDLTRYRGGPPCFWELYNREKEVGVTIQRLRARLDTGEIIKQRLFDIKKDDTLSSLQYRVFYETIDMGLESVLLMANPGFTPQKPRTIGKFYTLPTLSQWIRFQFTMVARGKLWEPGKHNAK